MFRNLRVGEEESEDAGLNGKPTKWEIGGEKEDEEKGFWGEEGSVERVLKERLLEEIEEEKRDLGMVCSSEVGILLLILPISQ